MILFRAGVSSMGLGVSRCHGPCDWLALPTAETQPRKDNRLAPGKVFEPERLGLQPDSFGIVALLLLSEMSADGFDAAHRQLGLEPVRRQATSASQFGVASAKLLDLIERAGHVFAELISQTIELKPDGTFEAWSYAGRPPMLMSRWSRRGRNTRWTKIQAMCSFVWPIATSKAPPLENRSYLLKSK
jgi:hypothetical protein